MTPYNMRKMAVSELRKTFLAMMSAQWDIALIGQPKTEVTKAAKSLLAIQRARLRLGNKKLTDIRDKLKENEISLIKGKEKLDKVLKNLKAVPDVLDAVQSFLKVIGEIVELAS